MLTLTPIKAPLMIQAMWKIERVKEGKLFDADGGLHIIHGIEDGKRHVSISHASRYPTWDEIKDVREQLCGEQETMAMILPPKSEYVNVHPFCFHLWQLNDKELTT